MGATVYVLCAMASFLCCMLLLRYYFSRRQRLLLWSSFCFLGLTANNVALFLDLVVIDSVNLGMYRMTAALIGMGCLLYALIWEVT